MIKSFYFLLAFFLSAPTIAQKTVIQDDKLNGIIPLNAEGRLSYNANGKVEGATKEELFKRARKWFVKTYNSAKDVLQVNDASAGELIGKGSTPTVAKVQRVTWHNNVNHTLTLDVKDGRYRIELCDFKVDGVLLMNYKLPYIATTQNHYTELYTAIDAHNKELIASLEKALKTADEF